MTLYSAICVQGTPTVSHLDLDLLDSYRFYDGGGFPASYREFVQHLGWGRLFGLWLVYPPVLDGYADGWQARSRILTERLREAYLDGRAEEFDWMIEPDGDWSLVESLRVFAISENGDVLLWDTAARDEQGEFPVYCSQRMNSLWLLGPSLAAAVTVLRAETVELFGENEFDLEPLDAQRLP
ncbi:SMI1/KNR4 family protein [Prescottella defluvii]|uniref:SMI1/KNR4 family protein n=1 Tax=Prescottella defluvii TaxID=1323361 RepID=UPI0004F3AB91|nr:SMI1/KNR4 family protein [Prescottella defluvii]